jgi:hypothetical protein
VGWRTWEDLRGEDFETVGGGPTVYVIFRPDVWTPGFLEVNPGGHHKGRDPTVTSEVLAAKWVAQAQVVYIGKADVANRRLKQFARFGAGEPIGHWGGRYIWQLPDVEELLVAWHPITWGEAAREYEQRLMRYFAECHGGARPFANLIG